MGQRGKRIFAVAALALGLVACSRSSGDSSAESCMTCHNASQANDYAGPGLENPHPFPGAGNLRCTACHGGNPSGADKDESHVPPPPEIGDRANLAVDDHAYFNRLTLTGIDKFPDYTVAGQTYTALEYLQFINPGDLRVVTQGRSCGTCHSGHAESVAESLLATEAGVLSGALFAIGQESDVPESVDRYQDTAADKGFRAVTDTDFTLGTADVGEVGRLLEFPVFSVRGANDIDSEPGYLAANVNNDLLPDGRAVSGSPLANLYHEQVAFTCGDCHLGSAGANNRYGDFRSSGCTACHMPYSLSGRSGSRDPNVNKLEPIDPDDIDEPELSHVKAHRIVSTARTDPDGTFVQGIDDYACAGCHQGSNRTVMQYWGIRLDQNEDLRRGVQYPAMPDSYRNTRDDTRLFDPVIGNRTFNGRRDHQYILEEDYDGDGLDDTPPDVHYEAGMGCIDCHGGNELHGGNVAAGDSPQIFSRMEQSLSVECESCHGSTTAPAPTVLAEAWDGQMRQVAVDAAGNPIPHVVQEGRDLFLYSRLTGNKHYVSQTVDTIFDNGAVNPITSQPVYSERASYAMGRADGVNVSCAACHASWTNSCIGCHLEGEFRGGGNRFSNITGQEIVFDEDEADFVYQSPVLFQLGVDTDDKVAPIAANSDMFFTWWDRLGTESDTFTFSDRNAQGSNKVTTTYPSLSHNVMMPHSIRGRVDSNNEGPRYCVACHLTTEGMTNFGPQYTTLRTALQGGTPASLSNLDWPLLQQHIGRNTGNSMNSPLWVHMAAGLGSGLFLFDDKGCAVNDLDTDINRKGCDTGSPKANFDINNVVYDLDRIVLEDGTPTGSNNHPTDDQVLGAANRGGALMSGPLSGPMILRLTDPNPAVGIHLDSWLGANGEVQGQASNFITP
jgi:hypothetical protein